MSGVKVYFYGFCFGALLSCVVGAITDNNQPKPEPRPKYVTTNCCSCCTGR